MAKPDKIDVDKILREVAEGMSVKKACELQKVSRQTFYDKIDEDPKLKDIYARSVKRRGESCIDRIEEYKEMLKKREIDPQTARVLIDTEKWEACKFYPRMYGDKAAVELTGANGGSISVTHDIDIDKIRELNEMLD